MRGIRNIESPGIRECFAQQGVNHLEVDMKHILGNRFFDNLRIAQYQPGWNRYSDVCFAWRDVVVSFDDIGQILPVVPLMGQASV